ncbi:MAG: STAS domain-containing protein [Chloroflexi bacterium]|nr:STAS domain-containing protein [Chloroflexota bacterium]
MEITITPGKIDVLAVSGTIDALTAAEITASFNKHIHDGHPDVVADFSNVEFMSSAGLRAILASVKEARAAGGDFRLACPQPAIDKLLKMAGFHNIVKIFPTVQDALASFGD